MRAEVERERKLTTATDNTKSTAYYKILKEVGDLHEGGGLMVPTW